MVSAADLRGYLVQPEQMPAGGVLILVEAITDTHKAEADTLARAGEVVLLLPPEVSTARGETYLNALPITRGYRSLCKREQCP